MVILRHAWKNTTSNDSPLKMTRYTRHAVESSLCTRVRQGHKTRGQDYKRFSSMSRCSTHNLCSEMT